MLAEPRLNQTLTLKDGRQLGYAEVGLPTGRPVIYCHGFPASRYEVALVAAAAEARGARLIALDRPGYGLSSFQPERRLIDWPHDVAEFADALGLGRFSVLAVSGGGPYGLALAHALPERVEALSVVAGLGPVADPELVRPMHPPAWFAFTTARHAPWLTSLVYGTWFGPFMRMRPELALALLTTSMREADRAMLNQSEIHAILCGSIREALQPGMDGALLDLALYAHDWGFDPGAIGLTVNFWHGDQDTTVPLAHSLRLVGLMPKAKLVQRAGEGHFSLPIGAAGEILDALLAP